MIGVPEGKKLNSILTEIVAFRVTGPLHSLPDRFNQM